MTRFYWFLAAWENALAALQELAPFAEENDVTIGVENVWNKFLLSPLEFQAFLAAVGSPRVGCYFNVGNVVAFGSPAQRVNILGDRITRVHFKDFQREVGTLDGFCALGEGDSDYPAVMAALKAAHYNGPVTAEFSIAKPICPPFRRDGFHSGKITRSYPKTLGIGGNGKLYRSADGAA